MNTSRGARGAGLSQRRFDRPTGRVRGRIAFHTPRVQVRRRGTGFTGAIRVPLRDREEGLAD
jgi:hypothetical protein